MKNLLSVIYWSTKWSKKLLFELSQSDNDVITGREQNWLKPVRAKVHDSDRAINQQTVDLEIKKVLYGSGCASVGRAVASDTRGLRFQSSHWRTFIHIFIINYFEKTKIKKKRSGMEHLKRVQSKHTRKAI